MADKVGSLFFDIEAKSGKFNSDLGKAEKQFEKTTKVAEQASKTVTGLGVAFSAFGAAVSGAIGLAVNSFAQAGDEIDKMSQRTGFSTKALQELGFAAGRSGAGLSDIEVSIRKMSKTLFDVENNSLIAVETLEKLGLTLSDLKGLAPEKQFEKMTEALAAIEDPTLKAALAQNLFGRSGTALLPLFTDGTEGLRKMREEAHLFSNVMSGETVKAAAEITDRMSDLKLSFAAVWQELALALLPVITDLVAKVQGVILVARKWVSDNQALFNSLATATAYIGGLSLALGVLFLAVGQSITAFIALRGVMLKTIPVVKSLWVVMAANPVLAIATALALATTALIAWRLRSVEAANANINMGKTIQDKIALMEAEKQKYKELATSGKLSEEERIDALNRYNAAFKTQKMLEQQLAIKTDAVKIASAKKAATKSQDLIDAEFQYQLLVGQKTLEDKRVKLEEEIALIDALAEKQEEDALREIELKTELFNTIKEMRELDEKDLKERNKRMLAMQTSLTAGMQSAFTTLFKDLHKGWESVTDFMQATADVLANAVIAQMANVAAEWIVSHGLMKAATLAWAAVEWVAAQAVAAAKIMAGWAAIPFVGVALGIAAIGAMIGAMGQFKGFAQGGVVGGSSMSGDNVMAAVNSGEMILNKGQQKTLFDIANGKGGGAGSQTIILNLDGRMIAKSTAENFPSILRLYGATGPAL